MDTKQLIKQIETIKTNIKIIECQIYRLYDLILELNIKGDYKKWNI